MQSTPVPDRFLEREHASLRYRVQGDGPAVVLIHGWLLDLAMWDGLADILASEFRVLRMDRRGSGHSSGSPDLQADGRDLVALLEHLRIESAIVVGMSQGARVALQLAMLSPRHVACLILDGAPPLVDLADRRWQQEIPLDRYRQILAEQGIGALRSALASHPLMRLHTADPAAKAALAASLGRYAGADLAATPGPAGPTAGELVHITTPVLVLNGDQDTEQRLAAGETLARAVPGAERRVIARAGHLACLDDPQAYASVVRDFVHRSLRTPAHFSREPT